MKANPSTYIYVVYYQMPDNQKPREEITITRNNSDKLMDNSSLVIDIANFKIVKERFKDESDHDEPTRIMEYLRVLSVRNEEVHRLLSHIENVLKEESNQ